MCVREQVPLLHADNDFDHLATVTDLDVVRVRVRDALTIGLPLGVFA